MPLSNRTLVVWNTAPAIRMINRQLLFFGARFVYYRSSALAHLRDHFNALLHLQSITTGLRQPGQSQVRHFFTFVRYGFKRAFFGRVNDTTTLYDINLFDNVRSRQTERSLTFLLTLFRWESFSQSWTQLHCVTSKQFTSDSTMFNLNASKTKFIGPKVVTTMKLVQKSTLCIY